jgi:hypothetical protein
MMYKIIAASCQRADIDSTGQVSSGYLVLGGLMLPCTIRCESDRYAMTFCGMSAGFNSSCNLCTGDLHCHEDGSSFSCLLLALARDRQYHTSSNAVSDHLMVLRRPAQPSTYQRIGMLCILPETLEARFFPEARAAKVTIL